MDGKLVVAVIHEKKKQHHILNKVLFENACTALHQTLSIQLLINSKLFRTI